MSANKLLTEFIGTLFLVLTVLVSTSEHGAGALAPLAIGAMLMVMVYMGGHISGAHYNPAVSLAVLVRGKMTPMEFITYVLAQILGAIGAAVLAYAILGVANAPHPADAAKPAAQWLVEILFTFALALVVLNVAVNKKTAGNSYYGLAIGFTVAAAAFAGGWFSGGAFNPAVGCGPHFVRFVMTPGDNLGVLALYSIGPLTGGLLAALVFKAQHGTSAD